MFQTPDPGDCERFPLKTDLGYAQVPWRHVLNYFLKKNKNFEASEEVLSFSIHTIWMLGTPGSWGL
jgi:hypothetical protein